MTHRPATPTVLALPAVDVCQRRLTVCSRVSRYAVRISDRWWAAMNSRKPSLRSKKTPLARYRRRR